jgi:hypothetical protein
VEAAEEARGWTGGAFEEGAKEEEESGWTGRAGRR